MNLVGASKRRVVDGGGAIPGSPPPDFLTKVIFQIPRGRTDQFDMFAKAV